MPYIAAAGELKTKPTQHSVRELMQIGIQPDILICRSEQPLSADIKRKIALFCNVDFGCVIESPDVRSIYEIPLRFLEQGLDRVVCERLRLETKEPDLSGLEGDGRAGSSTRRDRVRIAVVGKYTDLHDAYKSVQEALHPRRHRATTPGGRSTGSRATASPIRRRRAGCWRSTTAC